MTPDSVRLLAAAIAVGFGTMAAIGIGIVGGKALEGVARNPESAGTVIPMMILAIAFAEALGILAFVIAIIELFVVK